MAIHLNGVLAMTNSFVDAMRSVKMPEVPKFPGLGANVTSTPYDRVGNWDENEIRQRLQDQPDLAEVLLGALDLAADKNDTYQDAWREQGYMGNLARVLSKSSRIRNMAWCDSEDTLDGVESVEDTLLDLINLAAFAVINIREENRWGTER